MGAHAYLEDEHHILVARISPHPLLEQSACLNIVTQLVLHHPPGLQQMTHTNTGTNTQSQRIVSEQWACISMPDLCSVAADRNDRAEPSSTCCTLLRMNLISVSPAQGIIHQACWQTQLLTYFLPQCLFHSVKKASAPQNLTSCSVGVHRSIAASPGQQREARQQVI